MKKRNTKVQTKKSQRLCAGCRLPDMLPEIIQHCEALGRSHDQDALNFQKCAQEMTEGGWAQRAEASQNNALAMYAKAAALREVQKAHRTVPRLTMDRLRAEMHTMSDFLMIEKRVVDESAHRIGSLLEITDRLMD